MDKGWGALALAGLLVAGSAQAQEFKGAEVQAEILAFTGDSDLGQTSYRGSLEVGVFGGFGVQADLGFSDSRGIDFGARTMTLHGSYDLGGIGTAGLFLSRDTETGEMAGGDVDSYGIEGAGSFGMTGVEGFLGRYDAEAGQSGLLGGVQARYEMTASFTATGSAAFLGGDVEANRFAIGGEYQLGRGPMLYAEIGRVGVDDEVEGDDSQAFVTLGARVALGANGGTTFGERGIFDVLSGY